MEVNRDSMIEFLLRDQNSHGRVDVVDRIGTLMPWNMKNRRKIIGSGNLKRCKRDFLALAF